MDTDWTRLTGVAVAVLGTAKAIDLWVHHQHEAREELARKLNAPASLQVQLDELRRDYDRLRDSIALMGRRASDQLTQIQGSVGSADLKMRETCERLAVLEALLQRTIDACDRRHPNGPENIGPERRHPRRLDP